jgi:hypothetical protein
MIPCASPLRRWLRRRGGPDAAGPPTAGSSSGDAGQEVNPGTAKALNMQICRLAEMLPGGLEHEYGFSCECGCGETVSLFAADVDLSGGAWLKGHGEEAREPE